MSSPSVDDLIAGLSRSEQAIVKRLRALITECLPYASENCYYDLGVPFYRRHRLICFIWPASVYWGPKKDGKRNDPKGVSLGFCQGYLMSNEDGVLKAEGRKQVYVMYFNSLKEIDEAQVKALLFEAGMIDDAFGEKKKKAKAKKRKR